MQITYVKVKLSNSVLTDQVKSVESEHGVVVATECACFSVYFLLLCSSNRGEAGQRPGI